MWKRVLWVDLFKDTSYLFTKRFIGKEKPFFIIRINLPCEVRLFKFGTDNSLKFLFINKRDIGINLFLFCQHTDTNSQTLNRACYILIAIVNPVFEPCPIPVDQV